MKTVLLEFLFFVFSFHCLYAQDLSWTDSVGAQIAPEGSQIYNVTDFGAIGDSTTLNSTFIQAAIDTCSANGGGIVTFNAGSYLTGSVYLKANVHLLIPNGVIILGSQDINDYPEIDTRVAGTEMVWSSAIINVLDQDNVKVSGEGTINGQGKVFWDNYWEMREDYEERGLRWVVDYDCKRPRCLLVQNSTNVTIKGLNFQQSGFWTVHILYSSHCTVNGVTIRNNIGGDGPSTDGLDIDSSTEILIENCDVDCNDDTYCLKAGRDADGLRVNKPTEYVVIRNSVSREGSAMFTCGSETSGWIRNVLVENMEANGTNLGILLKSALIRGGGAENIYVRNSNIDGVTTAIKANVNWNPSYSYPELPEEYADSVLPDHWYTLLEQVEPEELGIPTFRNIYLSDIEITNSSTFIDVDGDESTLIQDVCLDSINAAVSNAGSVTYAKDWTVANLDLQASGSDVVVVSNSENVTFPVDNVKNEDALFETDFLSIPAAFASGDLWGKGSLDDAGEEEVMNDVTFGAGPYGQRVNFNNSQEANDYGSDADKYTAETEADNGATDGAFSFVTSDEGNGGGYLILPEIKGPFNMTIWNASGNEYDQKIDLYYGDFLSETVDFPGGKFIKKNTFEYEGEDSVVVKFVMSNQVAASNQNLYFYHILIEGSDSVSGSTSIHSVAEVNKTVVKTEYYDIMGRRISRTPGILLFRKSIYDDGSSSVCKVFIAR